MISKTFYSGKAGSWILFSACLLVFSASAPTGCKKPAKGSGDDSGIGITRLRPDPGPSDEAGSVNGNLESMPVKTIYIARHGRTHMNRIGWINGQFKWDHLDPLGYQQRVGLFVLLREKPIKAVFVSQLQRTHQTAAPLAAHFGLTPIIAPQLNEFRGGVFEGMCQGGFKDLPAEDPRSECIVSSNDPLVKMGRDLLVEEMILSEKGGIDYRAPGGGESVRDVSERLKSFLSRFPSMPDDSEILVVGHGGTNRFLLALLMGWKLEDSRKIRQGHTQVFRLERTKNGRPGLEVFFNGIWKQCLGPPHPKEGLECLRAD